jgi:hypothetical protein
LERVFYSRKPLEVCPRGVSRGQSVSSIGFGAFWTDSVEFTFRHELSVALKAFSFDFLLSACEGAAALVSAIGQEVPPWCFFAFYVQKTYHNQLFCREYPIRKTILVP